MPALAALVGTLFTSLAGFLIKLFLAKAAIRALGVAALIALAYGLVAAFNTYITPLVSAMFTSQYGQFLGLAFPPIAGTCIATMVAALGTVYVYRLKVRYVSLTAGV